MPGEKSLVAGRGLGLHDVLPPRREEDLHAWNECWMQRRLLGAAVSLWLAASARGQGGSAAVRSEMSPVRGCSTREGR